VTVPSLSNVGKINLPKHKLHWAAKIGIIFAVIAIDFLVLVGGVSFAAYFHFGLFEIPIAVGALCYAVGGNMITYNAIKLALLGLKARLGSSTPVATTTGIIQKDLSAEWADVSDAASGGLAITGIFLFLLFTLIGVLVFGASQLVKLQEGSLWNSLIMVVALVAMTGGLLPLTGRIAYKLGNYKAAEEFGYKKCQNGSAIVVCGLAGKADGDRTSAPDAGSGDGGGGFSF
jgi:uncharacterized integral membrane protein